MNLGGQMWLLFVVMWLGSHSEKEDQIVDMVRLLLRYGANPTIFARHVTKWRQHIQGGCDKTLILCDALEVDLSRHWIVVHNGYSVIFTKCLFHARHVFQDAGLDISDLIPEGFRRAQFSRVSLERLDFYLTYEHKIKYRTLHGVCIG